MAFPRLKGFDFRAAILATALGGFGAGVAWLIGLPLPFLLGSVLAVAVAALSDFRPFGVAPKIPEKIRLFFIPVIGVSIGSAFTPDVLDEIPRWWPSFLALLVYIPFSQFVGYIAIRRLGGVDPATAFYGAAPGGLIEAVLLGEQAGADTAMLTMLQFMRLLLCIVFIPIGISLWEGHAVGSAAGVVMGGDESLSAVDWAILIAAGVVGTLIAKRFNFPAWQMTGALLASSIVHLLGHVEGGPPGWLVGVTQLVIGITLGTRFVGKSPRLFFTALKLSGVYVLIVCALAAAVAVPVHHAVGESWTAVFLAFAPGGLAEMSLIALSLQISVIYVTAHHVLRIVLTVFMARYLAGYLLER
jgi:membrane AbrB-like protein